MDNEGNELPFLQSKLNLTLVEKEKLESEIKTLKIEMQKLNTLYNLSIEFSDMMEDDLFFNSAIYGKTEISHSEVLTQKKHDKMIIKLKSDLLFERIENDRIQSENRYLAKELNKYIQLQAMTVTHDSVLENELDSRLKEVSYLASTDNLTKIYNRSRFYESLYKELELNKLHSNELSVVMFHID